MAAIHGSRARKVFGPGMSRSAPAEHACYSAAMGSDTNIKEGLPDREAVLAAVATFAADSPALEARVFGSWARGTQTRRSDLDVLIVEETEEPFLRRLDRYLLPLYRIAGGPAVEVLVYDPSELAAMRTRPFIRRILEESVLVYSREEGGGQQVEPPGDAT